MDEPLTILVTARDEETVIGRTVAALRKTFPDAEVIVADDGSHDRTADAAEAAGAAGCSSATQTSRATWLRSSTGVT